MLLKTTVRKRKHNLGVLEWEVRRNVKAYVPAKRLYRTAVLPAGACRNGAKSQEAGRDETSTDQTSCM